MPQATNTPVRLPYSRLLRVTIAKSGPGLMTAKTVILITANHSMLQSFCNACVDVMHCW